MKYPRGNPVRWDPSMPGLLVVAASTGRLSANGLLLGNQDAFATIVGAVYGLSGGYFGGRVLTLVRLARRAKEMPS